MSFDFQAAYDQLNPADDDYRFYAALAARAGVTRAADLGCGTGTLARLLAADFAVMSGHVAQVFADDSAWLLVLDDLHRALVPGGLLAFESRNPGARAWEAWTRELTLRTVDTPDGPVEFWHQTAAVTLPRVSYDTLTRSQRTGAVTVTRDVLAFRDQEALRASVEQAGFDVEHVYGDWDQTPPADVSPELIVLARRR